jgi:hypothetical protein
MGMKRRDFIKLLGAMSAAWPTGAQAQRNRSLPKVGVLWHGLTHRLPCMVVSRETLEGGALMSYGADFQAIFRRTPVYVDKILKGEKPADLPVELPTKFEFLINLRTAKALGITISEALLVRADEVIEWPFRFRLGQAREKHAPVAAVCAFMGRTRL